MTIVFVVPENLLDATSLRGFPELLELELSGNSITEIGKDTFQPLMDLRILNLSMNALSALRVQVFGSSAVQQFALQQLDLSQNNIRLLFDNQFRLLGGLQMLDLSGNSIVSLNSLHFAGLQSLRKLYLQSNDLIEIKENTFSALEDLDTLDLSHNSIEYLGEFVFGSKTLPRLRKLNLNANNLKHLHTMAFSSLPFLEYLSLGNNEVRHLDERIFAPLRQLQKLHLGHNQLTELSSDILESLNNITDLLIDNNQLTFLPELNGMLPHLQRVAIEGNPWQCACFAELEHWLHSRQVKYLRDNTGFYNGEKPLCVVSTVENCVRNVFDDRHQDAMDEFEHHLNGNQSEEQSDEAE
ncbi:leucine-rich repeats and immunoglobulin-like domains protein 2 [Drosophila nasuta]|uniref:leucine-rich repeats and immunoglobulin-like domains protein 2 n=1 Tax=Drosophila nasuta TaxID=42062 RepID=UPI00295EDA94|nr:leucine-rich repeats and immunoglobulin-like domains protein 2 [Drosophila nasuta]